MYFCCNETIFGIQLIKIMDVLPFFQQLEEIHRKRQVEMTTTAREMERTYESRLQEQLQAMRAEFDERLNKNRREIDETYKVNVA